MRPLALGFAWALVGALLVTTLAFAQGQMEFHPRARQLVTQISDVVGRPLEEARDGPNGDSLQRTTTGLMVCRQADNYAAFTDGSTTWVNGSSGLHRRPNDERFPWEAISTFTPAVQPLYDEVFEEGRCDWNSGSLPNVKARYERGELQYTFVEPEQGITSIPWQWAPECFDLRAEVRFLTPGAALAGVVFNRSAADGSRHDFVLNSDGSYLASLWSENSIQILSRGEAPIFVRDGGVNRLRVVRSGGNVALYLNGEYVEFLPDVAPSGGGVGIGMASGSDPGVQIAWRGFTVYPLEEGQAPVIVTNSPETGWKRLESPLYGVSVSVPLSWHHLSMDPEVQERLLSLVEILEPGARETLEDQLRSAAEMGLPLAAADLAIDPDYPRSLSTLEFAAGWRPPGTTLEQLVELAITELEDSYSVSPAPSRRRFATQAGETVEIRFRLDQAAIGGTRMNVAVTQYYGVTGNLYYVLTLGTDPGRAERNRQVFEKVARSLEIK